MALQVFIWKTFTQLRQGRNLRNDFSMLKKYFWGAENYATEIAIVGHNPGVKAGWREETSAENIFSGD
jgi:hypothetical protein